MRTSLLSVLALLLPAAALAAPERPALFPTRDVTVSYQVHASGTDVREATAQIAAGGAHVRIEAPQMAGAMLLDRDANSMTMVLSGLHMYSVMRGRGHMVDEFLLDPRLRFTRAGGGSVAGLPCTDWRVSSPRGQGTGCVTSDGVLLRFDGQDERGRAASLLATGVHYGAIPAASFQPPSGFSEVTLPSMGR